MTKLEIKKKDMIISGIIFASFTIANIFCDYYQSKIHFTQNMLQSL